MNKKNAILRLIISLLITVLVLFLGSLVYTKFDLTQEKRHSLTQPTIDLMQNLDDQVFVRVYLHGDFPAQFKRLEKAVVERLDELVDYSNGNLSYELIDPYEGLDEKEYKEMENNLYKEGLDFTRISYQENGVTKYSNIWPGAIINYQGKTKAIQFFKSSSSAPTEEMINSSVNNLEFDFSSGLRSMMRKDIPRIAILEGHDELPEVEIYDFLSAMREFYSVEFVSLDEKINALSDKFEEFKHRVNSYEALVIAKPLKKFSRKDRLIIDQFIMNGGKVLWMIDPLLTDLDSLKTNQTTMAITNDLGIYPMLFDYGARINRNMILDYNCAKIAFDIGPKGNQRQMKLFNWYYSPVLRPSKNPHPISANLDPILTEFTSSIDTVGGNSAIKKSVLLQSSKLTKSFKAPVRVIGAIVDLDLDYFKNNPKPNQAIGVLLEGVFDSHFANRISDTLKNDPNFSFRAKSKPTKMIVISDGDICKNKTKKTAKGLMPLPLGYDRYAQNIIYDNREFLLNAINYLLDDKALITVRSRAIELRKLNRGKVKEEKFFWQTLNVILPLIVILLFGMLFYRFRRKKYQK